MRASIIELGYRPFIVASDAKLDSPVKSTQLADLVSVALREAGERGQFVFIDFYAPWCGACKQLEETTLSDPDVKTLLSGYVVLKIDTDEYPSIGKYFNVVGLPTLLVLNSSGEEMYRHAGPIDREPLIRDLREVPSYGVRVKCQSKTH